MNRFTGLAEWVQKDAPLHLKTAYRVGGNAEYLAEPEGDIALQRVLERAAQEGLAVRLLGHGTNLLVGDDGVEGLVVKLPRSSFSTLEQQGARIKVGAGHSLPALVKWSVLQNLSGLECLVGVPGTVGAALRMNAGGKYGEIGERVQRVWGFEFDGQPFHFTHEGCRFEYRNSGLRDRIVTGCELELELKEQDRESGWSRLEAIIREKQATQPLSKRSAGCVFKNPTQPGAHSAGRMIDELGFKGVEVGGASVSLKHANFLVCNKGARARDLLALIRKIRGRVLAERGILLHLEIATWGVTREELMPR